MFTIAGKYTTATVYADTVEPVCVAQIQQMVSSPSFTGPVAIMPDTHAGKGSVIGFTMPLGAALPPAVVGVDIGCGVLAAPVPWPAGADLAQLDRAIRARVPMGQHVHERAQRLTDAFDVFFPTAQRRLLELRGAIRDRAQLPDVGPGPVISYDWFVETCRRVGMDLRRAQASVGTLGGGNHFIEIGRGVLADQAWVLVHSGSRQLGERICKYHQGVAEARLREFRAGEYQGEIERLREALPATTIGPAIQAYKEEQAARVRAAAGQAPLHGADLVAYLHDMVVAQAYAALNRSAILAAVCEVLGAPPLEAPLDTVHNYIDPEDLIVRKGAVRARAGERLIIPFNMRDGSWLCAGRGNPAWNESAPHGAGRVMSRSQAKRELDPAAARAAMAGIYTSVLPLDEAPEAYKDAAEIRRLIAPTVEVIEEIRPVLNLKAE